MRIFIIFFIISAACSSPKKPVVVEKVSLGIERREDFPKYLSEWNLFEGEIHQLVSSEGVHKYDINAPLFSDYAHKVRFVKLPSGKAIAYNPTEVLEFPEQSILVKNFYYPQNFSKPKGHRRIIETRLLINQGAEWEALVYQWNEEQTDANRVILGADVAMEWTDKNGELQRINYSIPSQPQCKSCHDFNGKLMPIGPTARQLNRDGQLQKWEVLGILESGEPEYPKIANYLDESERLDDRARAWLEVNCAHCHRKEGPAKNTGLYLLASEKEDYRLGVNKAPIAAGKGSGGLRYSIVSGDPDKSILVHRITSIEPGEMMPELGRKMQHDEGVELIKEWILQMKD